MYTCKEEMSEGIEEKNKRKNEVLMSREKCSQDIKARKLFAKACAEYGLLRDGDKVLVALSGGKDSLELVRLFARQNKILKPRIQVEVVHVIMRNIPYKTDENYISSFCEELELPLHIIYTSFDDETETKKPKCFLCSWYRRKAIFNYAQQNGFNKIALGHHQDDILTTLLMNMLYEGSIQTMPPLLEMKHYPLTIIRPMCLIPESLIKEIAQIYKFKRQVTSCPYETTTKRQDVSDLFKQLEDDNSEIRFSLWKSMENIRENLLPRKLNDE